jgi:hypothetical protein
MKRRYGTPVVSRWLVFGAVMAALLLAALPAACSSRKASEPVVSLVVEDTAFPDALRLLFRTARVRYSMSPLVWMIASGQRRTANLDHVPLERAVRCLLGANYSGFGLTFRRVRGTYLIEGPRVDLDLNNTTVDAALQGLFERAGLDYVYPLRVANGSQITLKVVGSPFEEVFALILRKMAKPSGMALVAFEGVVAVRASDEPSQFRPTESIRGHLDRAPSVGSLKALCAASGANWIIGSGATRTRGTVSMDGVVTIRSALERMLRQLDLTYAVTDGVIQIVRHHTVIQAVPQ